MVAKTRSKGRSHARREALEVPIRRSARLRQRHIDGETSHDPLTGLRLEALIDHDTIESAAVNLSSTEPCLSPTKTDVGDASSAGLLDSDDGDISLSDSENLEYAYLPLQSEEIRLLKIVDFPSAPESHAIQVSLVRHNLLQRTDYVAVSYAWGTPYRKQVIETEDGTIIFVTSNLWDFLCAQHKKLAGRHLWIDQICINQRSPLERACQVRLMSRIFENAIETIVWLGKENEETERAFQDIQYFAGLPQDTADLFYKSTMAYPPEKAFVEGREKPLRDIFARSWFSRLWALQEAVLSASPTFVCGTKSASWDDFATAIRNVGFVFEFDFIDTLPTIHALRQRWQKGDPIMLLDLLDQTHLDFDCSDPRDKVYALLSMQSSHPNFNVDYTTNVEELFISVAQALIRSSGSIDLFGFADFSRLKPVPGRPVLPSWVPDWSDYSWVKPFPERFPFQACKNFVSIRQLNLMTTTSLVVEGRIIDWVHHVECPEDADIFGKADKNGSAAAQAYLRTLPDRIYHDIPGTDYILPKPFETSLVRTILAGHYELYGGPLLPINWTNEGRLWRLLSSNDVNGNDEREVTSLWYQVSRACFSRSILGLEERTIALGPCHTEPGDAICILHGSKLPIVLRPQDDKWMLIGQCYVDGVMSGEAVTWAEDEAGIFELI